MNERDKCIAVIHFISYSITHDVTLQYQTTSFSIYLMSPYFGCWPNVLTQKGQSDNSVTLLYTLKLILGFIPLSIPAKN